VNMKHQFQGRNKKRLENRHVDDEGCEYGTATLGGSKCVVSIAPSHGAVIRSLHGGSKISGGEPHDINSPYQSFHGRSASKEEVYAEGLKGASHQPDADAVSKHAKRFDAIKSLVSKSVKIVRKTEDFAGKVVGLDIGAALRGDAFIRNKKRRRTQSECVAIFVPVNAVGSVDSRICQIRSSAALACAQILEDSGQPVEVYGLAWSCGVSIGYDGLSVVKVKGSNEPFNLGQAASALSAWSWRSLIFGFRELGFANALEHRMTDGGGRSMVPTKRFCAELADLLGCQKFASIAHIPRRGTRWTTANAEKEVEQCTDALIEALKGIMKNDDAFSGLNYGRD